jgi:hypothetical protein
MIIGPRYVSAVSAFSSQEIMFPLLACHFRCPNHLWRFRQATGLPSGLKDPLFYPRVKLGQFVNGPVGALSDIRTVLTQLINIVLRHSRCSSTSFDEADLRFYYRKIPRA